MSLQYFGKGALRIAKNYTKGYSNTQAKVREATSNDPWGPSGTQMNEIAQLTYNQNDFVEITDMLDKRLNDKGKNWKHVFKSLTVLDYLLHVGSENVVLYFKDKLHTINTLKEFQYVDEDGKDCGANVRQKAKDVSNLLSDTSRLREARRYRASMRNRTIRRQPGVDEDEDLEGLRGEEISSNVAPPRRNRANVKDDDELKRTIEASKQALAEEQAPLAEENDIQYATRLGEEEMAIRNKAVQDPNAIALLDDQAQLPRPANGSNNPFVDPSLYGTGLQPQFTVQPQFTMQPQFASFNPYRQQVQREAMQAEYLRQQQEWTGVVEGRGRSSNAAVLIDNRTQPLAGTNGSSTPFAHFGSSDITGLQPHFPPPSDLTSHIVKTKNQYIAGGGFGDVYRCRYHGGSAPVEVAVKAFRFSFTMEGDAANNSIKMLRRELGIWRRLEHGNIVPFLGIAYGFGMDGAMSLVSPWMPNESLHKFLTKYDDDLGVVHRLQFLLDIAKGLHYLHSFSIVHGDLNCNNVLLDAEYTARLTDFGYASLVGNISEALTYLQRSTSRPGALRWIAPEQIDPEETFSRTTKSDIYSMGCVALQVLSGKLPWSEVREDAAVVLRLAKGQKPARPASRAMDDSHWDLIQQCLSSIEERPTAEAIIPSIRHFLIDCPPSPSLSDLFTSPATKPAKPNAETAPDDFIPEADTSMAIRLPPPHELVRPPSPSQVMRTRSARYPLTKPRAEIPLDGFIPEADASTVPPPHEFMRPPLPSQVVRTRSARYPPTQSRAEIPPDGFIPEADASTVIRLPPPHELVRSPLTQTRSLRYPPAQPHAETRPAGFIPDSEKEPLSLRRNRLPPPHELARPLSTQTGSQ